MRDSRAQGWVFSLFLHGSVVSGALFFEMETKPLVVKEPFKWEVSLVEAPKPADQPPPQSTPAPATPAPTETQPAKPQPVETKPVIQTVQARAVQTVQPVQQVVKQEVREVKPLVQAIEQSTRMVGRTVQSMESVQPTPTETIRPAEPRGVVSESVVSRPTVETAPPPVVSPQVIADAKIVPPSATSVISQLAEEAKPALVPDHAVVKPDTIRTAAPVVEEASARELPVRSAAATKADYGWLAKALWDRVSYLKHYPHLARVQHLEGRVVVRAVIRQDGHLAHVEVAESSGHSVLDADALEIIRRACPLKLTHPLGRPQVVVQVPINYRLER
jgi:protein TonB